MTQRNYWKIGSMQLFNSLLPLLSLAIVSVVGCSDKKPEHKAPSTTGFAVVELFTSEGCSSCPPADKLLAELKDSYPKNVYVLEYHVDYWNHLGWADKFSDSTYSHRQMQYARQFNLQSVYTPEAVVNGTKEMVGSDRSLLTKSIKENLDHPAISSITLSATQNAGSIEVSYRVEGANGELLNIALVQNQSSSQVGAGENAGRMLVHANIVRSLHTVALSSSEGTTTFMLPQGLTAADCSIIAYTQRKNDLQITGAAQISLPH